MPRERIHHGTMYVLSTPDNEVDVPPGEWLGIPFKPGEPPPPVGSKIQEEPSLDVSWQRDAWVQVSIDISRDKWIEIAKEVDEDKDLISKAIYTETLSRDEINKMIRTLRKARDQAFGADE